MVENDLNVPSSEDRALDANIFNIYSRMQVAEQLLDKWQIFF